MLPNRSQTLVMWWPAPRRLLLPASSPIRERDTPGACLRLHGDRKPARTLETHADTLRRDSSPQPAPDVASIKWRKDVMEPTLIVVAFVAAAVAAYLFQLWTRHQR